MARPTLLGGGGLPLISLVLLWIVGMVGALGFLGTELCEAFTEYSGHVVVVDLGPCRKAGVKGVCIGVMHLMRMSSGKSPLREPWSFFRSREPS